MMKVKFSFILNCFIHFASVMMMQNVLKNNEKETFFYTKQNTFEIKIRYCNRSTESCMKKKNTSTY